MAPPFKLKPEIKERWLRALRDGEYKQGRRRLRTDHTFKGEQISTFCCLGVLCDLAASDGLGTWTRDNAVVLVDGVPTAGEYGTFTHTESGESATGFLPMGIIKWAFDLPEGTRYDAGKMTDPEVGPRDDDTLANRNDGGFNFDQIADEIEVKL